MLSEHERCPTAVGSHRHRDGQIREFGTGIVLGDGWIIPFFYLAQKDLHITLRDEFQRFDLRQPNDNTILPAVIGKSPTPASTCAISSSVIAASLAAKSTVLLMKSLIPAPLPLDW